MNWLIHFKIFCIVLMLSGATLSFLGYLRERKDKIVRRRLAQLIDEREQRLNRRLEYANRILEQRVRQTSETTDEIIADLYHLLEEWEAEREIRTRVIVHELGQPYVPVRECFKVNWKREGF